MRECAVNIGKEVAYRRKFVALRRGYRSSMEAHLIIYVYYIIAENLRASMGRDVETTKAKL